MSAQPPPHAPPPPVSFPEYDPDDVTYLKGWWRVALPAVTLAAVGGACLYTYVVDPNSSGAFPQCPLRMATGLDCPGCGGLRGVHALLHGDVVGAADHNLLALVLLPFMAYMLLRWALLCWNVKLPRLQLPSTMSWVLPVAFIAFWIGRNIPFGPLGWLNSAAA